MLNEDSKYIGQCDNIRSCRFNKNNIDFFKNIDTEKWWEDTLKNSSEISKKEFLLNVNPHEILDSDESFDDFLINLSDTYNFYKTNNIYFIKTSGTNGFEWFWVKNNSELIKEVTNTVDDFYNKNNLKGNIPPALLTWDEYYQKINQDNDGHAESAYNWNVDFTEKMNPIEKGYKLIKNQQVGKLLLQYYSKSRLNEYVKRNDKGDYIGTYSEKEMISMGISPYEVSFICLHDGFTIGSAQDEWGCTLVQVGKEYRSLGIGETLIKLYREVYPNKPSGGFTYGGYQQFKKYYNWQVNRFLASGIYSDMVKKGEITIERVKNIVGSRGKEKFNSEKTNKLKDIYGGNNEPIYYINNNTVLIFDSSLKNIKDLHDVNDVFLEKLIYCYLHIVVYNNYPQIYACYGDEKYIEQAVNIMSYQCNVDGGLGDYYFRNFDPKIKTILNKIWGNNKNYETTVLNDKGYIKDIPLILIKNKQNLSGLINLLKMKTKNFFKSFDKYGEIEDNILELADGFINESVLHINENSILLTEKLANVDSDVDFLYNKYFKTDIDELNRTGIIRKEMFEEYQGDNTNILNSEDSIKANETNRCELIINNRLGNAYRPSTKTIFLSANRNAINYVLNEFNGDYNDALDSLKGGNQYNSFKMEFTEERIKGSIHHELAHWIDDTNNNQHINKRTQIATKLGTRDINNIPVDSTKMEIQGQIHNIKQVYNKYKENWNELSLRDLFNLTPTLNIVFNNLKDSFKKQWVKDLILRMNRENLLGDKMRLNNYYTLNENNNETPNEYIERKKRQIDDEPNYQVFVDRIIKELKNNGLENDYYSLSKSQTTFGQSWYIIFKNGLEIRISNHSVTSNNRILDNKYVAFINVHKKYSDDDIKNIINEYIRLKNIKDEIEYKQQSSFNKLKEIDAKIKNNSLEFIENLKNNKKAIFDSGKTFQTIDTIKEKHPDWENVLQLPYQNGFIYYYIKQNNGYGNYNINKEYYNFLVKNNIINKDMINENTLNEENSDLKGTILKIVSPNIQKHLDDLIKQYGDKAEIIKHIVSAIDEKPEYSLTYEYAKKIKNYFDNFKGNNTSEEYQLHGGIKLKNYINLILAMKRDSISTGKDIRKNMTILNNTHLKSHDKSTIGLTRNPMALKEHIELIENYIPTKKASCGVILNPEKSILLVKRGVDTKWFPGKWALVGGKVDGDEEFKDAFIREVKEETNLDLDFIKYCYNKHDGDCEVALFVAITKTPNDIKINKEHSEYKWCTANEIKELDCVPHIYEDISECLKLLINNKEDLLAEEYKHSEYLSWKRKNVTIRGIKEAGQENNAGAMLGRGLYTAFLSNKELAKQYGTVKFVVNAIPKKAKVFNSLNEWEIFFYNTLIRNYCKEHGLKESRTNFSQNTTIEDEMQKLGFDGIIIKGREMVNYKPENVLYFGNENQLKFYYEDIT